MASPRFGEMVAIGAVVRPQGRKGEVLVQPLSDRPDRFPKLQRAFLPGAQGGAREVRVEWSWPHKGRFVVKIAGVDSIDAAEALRGQELRIGEDALEALPPGSYYHHQLKGLRVEDPSGRELGTVDDVQDVGAGAPVLVVRGRGKELLLPLAEGFVHSVDLERRVMVVLEPESVEA